MHRSIPIAAGLLAALAFSPAFAAPPPPCPTATGNASLNENDFDYNQAHMLPPGSGCDRAASRPSDATATSPGLGAAPAQPAR